MRAAARGKGSHCCAVVLAAVVVGSCSGGNDGHEQAWCELMAEVGLAAKAVHESVERSGSPEPELRDALEDAGVKVQELGWPDELKDEQVIIGDGPATNEPDDLEAYDQALQESQRFVLERCDLDRHVAETVFGG